MGFFFKRKIAKNILYFLSEIVVVVIGIFIAFQLTEWKEKKQNSEKEIVALQRIQNDLKSDVAVFLFQQKDLIKNSDYLKDVLYHDKTDNLDSLRLKATSYYAHLKFNSEYVSLKSSGNLNLIKNDSLRGSIVAYYEANYGLFDEVADGHKNLVNTTIEPYLIQNFVIDSTYLVDPKVVKAKLEHPMFINILTNQIAYTKVLTEGLTERPAKSIIKFIDQKLDNQKFK
ncbi:DUF6090 family protein [Nonlabens ponticola]|uniref:Uncharacterized protein n=1 Tax=Nonlabens ponticola TaxID=2496866 RepID=A0A3S9MXA6_9FLAO|nr:DUF6090 family protein [Nonlabens ponticola]AZQ43693.1 hypothetical protein EJ995_05415 [Nonlabens ponticola]